METNNVINCVEDQKNNTLTTLVGKFEREKIRISSYKVGSKEYNNSYKLIERLKEDIVERACMLFSPYADKDAMIKVENKEEN